jgi:predicted molibdopterin-dependent oxidoreductase YjgC
MAGNTTRDAARTTLEADAFRESEEGYCVDCPECGTATPVATIVETGRCSGYAPEDGTCRAELRLELAWRS